MNDRRNEIRYLMNLPGGMNAVRLAGPDIVFDEIQKLNLGISYRSLSDITDNTEYYALRSDDGISRVIIAVKNGAIQMCRAMNDSRPVKYMSQIVTFIVERKLGIDADMACTGIIRQGYRYYNVYDLPNRFTVFGNMDLSYASLVRLPNMRGITIRGNYDISGNSLIGFSGAPSEVFGDFIFRDNEYPYVAKKWPQRTIIHGRYIVGQNVNER